MAAPNPFSKLTMYGYFRSSCAGRLRIALYFKNLDFDYHPVNLKNDHHLNDEYTKINPSRSVPTFFIPGKKPPITQSVAALEYLEEAYPDAPPLLPNDPYSRGLVRNIVNIVACDIQPVTNMRIMKFVTSTDTDPVQWSRDYHASGFNAIETLLKDTAGEYCVGDEITLADVCLAPAVWNAERWKLDMNQYPLIQKVYENASRHPAFKAGHWKQQVDCPEDLR